MGLSDFWKVSLMLLNHDISATLTLCAQQLQTAKDPWWVIGSTAVALQGVDPGPINDIDILVSVPDAKRLAENWQCPNTANTGSEWFRSQVLLKPDFGCFPVEVMAGLEFRALDKWLLLAPKTRQEIYRDTHSLFVPNRPELIKILRSFGREKDIRRANLLSS